MAVLWHLQENHSINISGEVMHTDQLCLLL